MRKYKYALLVAPILFTSITGSAQKTTASPGQCSVLYNAASESYGSGVTATSQMLFKECEECCSVLRNDMLLVNLYLLDSQYRYFDKILVNAIKSSKSKDASIILAGGYNKCAVTCYNDKPDLSTEYFKKAISRFLALGDTARAAMAMQNLAFTYDEKLSNINFSLNYTLAALELWKVKNDTLSIANLYKYAGYLMGKQTRFAEGKKYVDSAITYYTQKQFDKGIAVSLFDLAQIYKYEGRIDSSIYQLLQAKTVWRKYEEFSRLFPINTELINLYILSKNDRKIGALVDENLKLDTKHSDKLLRAEREAFYLLVRDYYLIKDKRAAGKYDQRYNEIRKSN